MFLANMMQSIPFISRWHSSLLLQNLTTCRPMSAGVTAISFLAESFIQLTAVFSHDRLINHTVQRCCSCLVIGLRGFLLRQVPLSSNIIEGDNPSCGGSVSALCNMGKLPFMSSHLPYVCLSLCLTISLPPCVSICDVCPQHCDLQQQSLI